MKRLAMTATLLVYGCAPSTQPAGPRSPQRERPKVKSQQQTEAEAQLERAAAAEAYEREQRKRKRKRRRKQERKGGEATAEVPSPKADVKEQLAGMSEGELRVLRLKLVERMTEEGSAEHLEAWTLGDEDEVLMVRWYQCSPAKTRSLARKFPIELGFVGVVCATGARRWAARVPTSAEHAIEVEEVFD